MTDVPRRRQPIAAIAVLARVPSSGGKTRLAPHLPAHRLAALRTALLADTLQTVAGLEEVVPTVCFTPDGAAEDIAALTDSSFAAMPQRGGDLGERMCTAFHHLLVERGHDAVVLVGTDMPFLTADHITDALATLRTSGGVVLGPADDGGYYLIGMTSVHAALFDGIEWGGPSVLTDTLRAADRLGIEARLIRSGYDIDTIEDLRRLERELAGAPPEVARHVRDWFSEES